MTIEGELVGGIARGHTSLKGNVMGSDLWNVAPELLTTNAGVGGP